MVQSYTINDKIRSKWVGEAENKLLKIRNGMISGLHTGKEIVMKVDDWENYMPPKDIKVPMGADLVITHIKSLSEANPNVYINPTRLKQAKIHGKNLVKGIVNYLN